MAEMDPIIRDALKRSSQMQGAQPKHQQRQTSRKTENKKQENNCAVESETPAYKKQEKATVTDKPQSNSLNFLFENKDQSLILLLVVLLMNEDSDPMLLLALMYLLI